MVASQIPLKVRQGFILVFVLLVALPILFFSIGKAYYASLVEATEKTLEAHLYSLISEVDFTERGIIMPSTILAPELNRLNSDTYAMIYREEQPVWHSESAVNVNFVPDELETKAGAADFRRVEYKNTVYWQLSLTVILNNIDQSEHARFILLKRNDALLRLMDGFKQTLVNWMYVMGVAIAALMAVGFVWSARPLQRLDKEIKAIESGDIQEIKGLYPVELQTIKADLNLLLETQQRQKERYRASLSDLAHALKTPLAVLKSSPLANDADAQEQLDRINVMIEHQLKRAATGASDTWKKQTAIKPVLDSILNAMSKVYRDKDIIFTHAVKDKDYFLGDKTDLLELLGNLIDNACKACRSQVDIQVIQKRNLTIAISDDGPGVPIDKRESLLTRGTRLDTYESGHGVGMAIVSDLVKSYHGTLTILDADTLGGAKFILEFNYNDKK
ncbi:GHKL domain-containing protein [Pseudoalteromonas sp. SR44-5]|uniref:histidine kinase n=1 Tax=Pseudoalteromonas rhizosphaerae TaxID=2518973 RepID=A0ABW8KVE1_9GAMM|nr:MULTISPECIES: ATP-binding protein [Pseudoalteromonas]MBB1335626.1 GHKL domain-containing protein [Pseudoalteromonas sp. SR41-6]MBB1340107.1 GHKL domain-containing protein [Pseudoalteromonas sp. SR45-6]MBB1367833.1 GHKL domain-containing protein [Pseudoalteromonas sp. SR44-5]MBB1418385.1 GHKL domain-containing protein [Pseudoalteromonas sp. SG44-1]MBB1423495.1 GHKL domain-containing protein [Pseudoalteromonas sp. SG43-7]